MYYNHSKPLGCHSSYSLCCLEYILDKYMLKCTSLYVMWFYRENSVISRSQVYKSEMGEGFKRRAWIIVLGTSSMSLETEKVITMFFCQLKVGVIRSLFSLYTL